jgi:hypothetical protein
MLHGVAPWSVTNLPFTGYRSPFSTARPLELVLVKSVEAERKALRFVVN